MIEEPTLGEVIRDIQADVRALLAMQERFVTKDIHDLEQAADRKRLDALEERDRARVRLFLSVGVLPFLVGLSLFLVSEFVGN